LESGRGRAANNVVVDFLIGIVGFNGIPQSIPLVKTTYGDFIDGLVRQFRDAAAPFLRLIYADPRVHVRECVVSAFCRIHCKVSVPFLIEACRDPAPEIRLEAIAALERKIGDDPASDRSSVVQVLTSLLDDTARVWHGSLPSWCATTNLPDDPVHCLPPQQARPPSVCVGAVRVLARIGEPALSGLIAACRSVDADVRREAVLGITKIGTPA
jgi:hypothetical protein